MREVAALPNARIPLGRQGENEATRVVWPGIAEKYRAVYGAGVFALGVQRSDETEAHPAALTREGDDLVWVVTAEDTAAAGQGRAELQYLVGDTVAKSKTWLTEVYRALKPVAPSGEPGAAWYAAIQAQIGDLDDLTTKAKENLVAAVNEAAKSGGGGAAAEVEMRVDSGYIQFSADGGETWENLIAQEELKGDKGADGAPGKDGADGAPGAAGKDGASVTVQSVSESAEDGGSNTVTFSDGKTLSVKNGKTGAKGADGAPGAAGKDGAQGAKGDPGEDYVLTEADKNEIAEMAAALVPTGGGGGSDISLGITGAEVGQTVKVTAVGENGRPTAWEAAEGNEWRLIHDFTLSENVDRLDIETDGDGAPFLVHEIAVVLRLQSYDDTTGCTFLVNKGWTSNDPYMDLAPVMTSSSEDWKQMYVIRALAAGGYSYVHQYSRSSMGNLSSLSLTQASWYGGPLSAYQNGIYAISLVAHLIAGCRVILWGRN